MNYHANQKERESESTLLNAIRIETRFNNPNLIGLYFIENILEHMFNLLLYNNPVHERVNANLIKSDAYLSMGSSLRFYVLNFLHFLQDFSWHF